MMTIKKVLTILLCMTLVISAFPACMLVSAIPDVVFELEAATLTDKSGNNIALETLGTVLTDSFKNQAGETVSYMTTGQEGDSLTNSSTAGLLRTTDESITKLKDYTIETWVRYKAPANDNWPKMFKMGNSAGNNVFALEMPNNYDKKLVLANDGSPYIIYQSINTDTWMHLVVTFDTVYGADGTTIEKIIPNMYINGNDMYSNYGNKPQLTDATKIAMFNAITEFTIGGSTNNGSFGQGFSADFATFKIYNSVMTQDEIAAMYNDSKDYYVAGADDGSDTPDDGGSDTPDDGGDTPSTGGESSFEDGEVIVDIDTANLVDCSGNDIPFNTIGTVTNGSFTNMAGETVTYMTTGQGNDALSNSSTAGFLLTDDENITKLKDYTIETWVRYRLPASDCWPKMFKMANAASNNVLVMEMPNFPYDHKLVIGNTQNLILYYDKNTLVDEWAHYVFTFDAVYGKDGTTVEKILPGMYINGENMFSGYASPPQVTDTTALAMLDEVVEFAIGGNPNNGSFNQGFPGDFASFKIYKGIKTQNEAAELYNDSKYRFIESTISMSSITFEGGELVAGAENVPLEMPDVYVEFSSDVNMGTVNETTLKLVDKTDGFEVPYTVTVEGDKAIVSIDGKLGKNKEYRIEITEGVLKDNNSSYGQLFANFATIKGAYAGEDWTIKESDGTVTAALTAKSDNSGGDFAQHILIIYEVCEDYILPVFIDKADATVTSGTDLGLSADISALPEGNYKAVSTLWGSDLEVYGNQTEVLEFVIEKEE